MHSVLIDGLGWTRRGVAGLGGARRYTHNHLQLVQLNIVQVDLCPDLAVPVENNKNNRLEKGARNVYFYKRKEKQKTVNDPSSGHLCFQYFLLSA